MTDKTQPHAGPWKTVSACVLTEGEPTLLIAYVAIQHGQEQAEANARLIAAAPDLLRQLGFLAEAARSMADPEHCLHGRIPREHWRKMATEAAAALAKAEGR